MRIIGLHLVLLALFFSCAKETKEISITSPDSKIILNFNLNEEGSPYYQVSYDNEKVIDTSFLGFEFKDLKAFNNNFKILNSNTSSFNETWQMPWGEQIDVVNKYNELSVSLQETVEPFRLLNIVFKVFDDGLGFRYEFPEQDNMKRVLITDENTQFNLTGDHRVWWIPGDWDIYEHLYNECKFSEIDAISKRNHPNLSATYIPENAVNTPVTMKTDSGLYLSFHEADLTNYAGMTLKKTIAKPRLISICISNIKFRSKFHSFLGF